MELADKGLNPQAQAIEEAQTEIRIIVRDGWQRIGAESHTSGFTTVENARPA